MTVELESSLTSHRNLRSRTLKPEEGESILLYIFRPMSLAAPVSQLLFPSGASAPDPYLTEESCVIALNRYWRNRVLHGEMYAREAQRSMHVRGCPKFLQKKSMPCDSKLD